MWRGRRRQQRKRQIPKNEMDEECVEGMPQVALLDSMGLGCRINRLRSLARCETRVSWRVGGRRERWGRTGESGNECAETEPYRMGGAQMEDRHCCDEGDDDLGLERHTETVSVESGVRVPVAYLAEEDQEQQFETRPDHLEPVRVFVGVPGPARFVFRGGRRASFGGVEYGLNCQVVAAR